MNSHNITLNDRDEAFLTTEYKLILNTFAEGIFILSNDGRINFANSAATEITGMQQDEMIGNNILDLTVFEIHNEMNRDLQENPIYNTLKNDKTNKEMGKVYLKKKSSYLPIHYTLRVILRDGNQIGVVMFFSDFAFQNDQSNIEQALRDNLRQLSKKNRYEQIMNIVARSVHRSIKIEEVLKNSVVAMSENIEGVENVSIYMIEGKEAVIKAWKGYSDYYIKHAGKIPYPKGATWKTIISGRPSYVKDVDHDTAIGAAGRKIGIKSYVTMPIKNEDGIIGALIISSYERNVFDEEELILLEHIVQQIEIAINNAQQAQKLQTTLSELEQLKNHLQDENKYLHEEIKTEHNFDEIIGESNNLKILLRKVELVAPTDATVLIQGETGTGKELIARSIHNLSPRRAYPFIRVNCGAIAPSLFESELFGHEKGAFTGAIQQRTGRFELAGRGTIFLDEVGELPIETQVKLLRVLQEHTFERVGGNKSLKTDARVIAATNRDITEAIKLGTFRKDLYFRLNVFPLELPPLRQRISDIPVLVKFFIDKFSRKLGKKNFHVSDDSLEKLKQYKWPGNIRELQNVIERAIILSSGQTIIIDESQLNFDTEINEINSTKLEDVEREHIVKVVEEANWVIEGNRGAANMLGLKPSTLRYRLKKLGIERY